MKTAEEILLDKVGKLALSGLKWKSLNDRKERILEAMEEYKNQGRFYTEDDICKIQSAAYDEGFDVGLSEGGVSHCI
jgi:hypothetical protein